MWSCLAFLVLFAFVCRTVESTLSTRNTEDSSCQFVYTNGTTENTIQTLIKWQTECQLTWLYSLNVTAETQFTNATIPLLWLHLIDERSIQVQRLTIDLTHVEHIQRLAFATNCFSGSTQSLTLINLTSSALSEQSLIGLNVLSELRIVSKAPLLIPACLCGVSHTVTSLYIGGPNTDTVRSINPLTSTILPRVAVLELSLNLRDTIDEHTFLGMSALAEIRLSHCRIEVIGPNTFYAVRRTLRLLRLDGNRLSRLPMGLLNTLLPSPMLYIAIHDNPWICDCRLYDLQMTLSMYEHNFELEPLCDSPAMFANQSVMSSEFCAPLRPTNTPGITLETTEATTHAPDLGIWVDCFDQNDDYHQSVSLKRRDEQFRQAFNFYDERLEVRPQAMDYRVLMQRVHSVIFHNGHVKRALNVCNVSAKAVFSVVGNNTSSSYDVVLSVCIQPLPGVDYQVSPFNCITFYEEEPIQGLWISTGLRTKTLVLAYGIFLVTIAIGCVLGYGLHHVLPGQAGRLDCVAYGEIEDHTGNGNNASSECKTSAISSSLTSSYDSLHMYESISDLSRFEIVRRELIRQKSLDADRQSNIRRPQRSLRKTQSAIY